MVLGTLDNHIRNNKIGPLIKINWKCIKDINITPNTIKLLEENLRKKLLGNALGNDFLDMMPKGKQQKKKINKDYI